MSRSACRLFKRVLPALALVLALGAMCSPEDGQVPSGVLVNQNVSVGAGGGFANVTFSASAGQTIRITLTAAQTSMMPYANLAAPNGSDSYTPPQGTASNGVNTAQVTLGATGTYTLTVFDGSNQGGVVTVRVERVS